MTELENITKLLGVSTDSELAEKLEIKPGTISSWRSRGKVPDMVIRKWSIQYGKPVEWFTGGGDDTQPPQVP